MRICYLHFPLQNIHPFEDGSGQAIFTEGSNLTSPVIGMLSFPPFRDSREGLVEYM